MPHHWWLIDPDNPGPRQRAKAVRKAAREFGAEVVFVGQTSKNTWFALVNVENPEDEERDLQGRRRPREALRARGPGEDEKKPRRRLAAMDRGDIRRRTDVPVEGARPAALARRPRPGASAAARSPAALKRASASSGSEPIRA